MAGWPTGIYIIIIDFCFVLPQRYNVLDDNEIQGEEDGMARIDGETKFTPFNMKEEMEEGHFDADGHYLWKKQVEVNKHRLLYNRRNKDNMMLCRRVGLEITFLSNSLAYLFTLLKCGYF